jgi:type I restriction enzyme R subunit
MDDDFGQLFDPQAEVFKTEHHLPHWAQAAAITFVTMRLRDSIPAEVIERWDRERLDFLRRHGIVTNDWRVGCQQLDPVERKAFRKHFERARQDTLDTCLGDCILRQSDAAGEVAAALTRFDNDRYVLGDTVIMPNHVHFLIAFKDPDRLRRQCGEWMRYTARRINTRFHRLGSLWYAEPFDHLVRSERQLGYLRHYIAQNHVRAGLSEGEFLYRPSGLRF